MDKLKALLQETFPHIDFEKEKNLKYITPQNFESVENIWSMIQELSEEGKK